MGLSDYRKEKITLYAEEKIRELRNALECLKDEYVQYVDNACHCDEYDDNEECSYCYAKRVLEETK